MRILIAVMFMFLMSGCTTYETFKEGSKVHAAKAADEVDKVAIYAICTGNSRGSLTRNWMDTQDHFDTWVDLCFDGPDIEIFIKEFTEPE
jgi:hypothetical protein